MKVGVAKEAAARAAPETTRAAVLAQPGRIEVGEIPLPDPGPTDVVVRLQGCGVCGSNLGPWKGAPWFDYPFPPGSPGHEGWGLVEVIGADVHNVREGDRVATLGDRAFADYMTVPAAEVVPLPPELDAIPFPGEPLGCAMNVFQRSGIEEGRTVAVVGIGFLGALVTQLAVAAGARVIGLSRRPFARDVAARAGAYRTLDVTNHDAAVAAIEEETGGMLCDVVVEATGKQGPLDLAGRLTRVRGRLVIAGYHQDGTRQVDMQLWNWRGLDVINAHERDPSQYLGGVRQAVEATVDGRLDPEPLITDAFALERLGDALDATRDRPDGFLKAIVRS